MPIQKVEISVTTQSQRMTWGSLPPPAPPKITMNGNPIPNPPNKPWGPSGWQLVIIDPTKDITQPASYLYNNYIILQSDGPSWMGGYYERMYGQMLRNVLLAGNIESQLAIVASFGLDANMPPTTATLPLLFELGAGPRLQYWETHCNPGSEAGGGSFIAFPANYILIGYSSYSYGQGHEKYEPAMDQPQIQSTVSATVSNIVPG